MPSLLDLQIEKLSNAMEWLERNKHPHKLMFHQMKMFRWVDFTKFQLAEMHWWTTPGMANARWSNYFPNDNDFGWNLMMAEYYLGNVITYECLKASAKINQKFDQLERELLGDGKRIIL